MKKPDFYTLIHKSIRRRLFLVAMTMGTTDFEDTQSFATLSTDLSALIVLLRSHAQIEETHFHPLIRKMLPEMNLDAEHRELEQSLQSLAKALEAMTLASSRRDLGSTLYLQFNDFLGHYLQHLADEERMTPLLWEHFATEELVAPVQAMFKSFSPEYIQATMQDMRLSLNPQELASMGL